MNVPSSFSKLLLMILITFAVNVQSQDWLKIVNKPDATFEEIQKDAEKYFDKRGRGKGTGYKQYQRWRLYHSARLMPNGKLADVKAMIEKAMSASLMRAGVRAKTAASGSWTSLGPTKVLNGAYAPGQGRVNRMAVDPSNTSTLYAGTNGGLYKTTDAGTNWSLLNKGSESVSGIVIDPNSSATLRTLYILTGDADGMDFTRRTSTGVIKSTDGGVTWGAPILPWTAVAGEDVRGYKMINDPANGQILLVVSSKGIHKSTNGGTSWATKQIGYFYDIVYKPGSSAILFAAANEGVFKSTNGGDTWTLLTSVLPQSPSNRIALGVTPANSNYLYIYYGDSGFSGSTFKGLYRSTDGGVSFQLRTNDAKIMQAQLPYDLAIAVSPTNAEQVFVGAVSSWKSTDGGITFNPLANSELGGPSNYMHNDYHAFVFAGSILYAGNDAGVFKSSDAGTTWSIVSNGLDILQVIHFEINPADPSTILTGTQDIGTESINNFNNTQQFGGDGFFCFFDPTNTNRFYGSYNNGNLLRSDQNWAQAKDYSKEIDITPAAGRSENPIMNTPFVMDPTNPSVLYAGYKNLYKSIDRGANWNAISNDIDFDNSNYCTRVELCDTKPNYIYVAKDARIMATTDGGTNWNLTSTNTFEYIQDIEVHPIYPSIVWKVLGGYSNDQKVFVTKDGGVSWKDLNPNKTLPNVPILSIVYHKGSNGGIYIGTDVGVFYMDSTLTDWIPFSTGLPAFTVMDLKIDYKNQKLIAGTFGRGLWSSDLFAASTNAPVISITYPSNGSTIALSSNITVELNATVTNPIAKVELYHGNAKIGEDLSSPYNISWTNASAGTYTLIAKAVDNKGIVAYSSYVTVTLSSTVALPSPWKNADIGSVALAGSASYSSGTFTVKASGADIWGTADAMQYVYQPVSGDVEIIAKVNSITNSNAWAKGGVMVRETLNSNSKNAAVIVSPTSGMNFQSRSTAGGSSVSTGIAGAAPIWMKLNRTGNVFTAYKSADGVTWTQIGSPLTLTMTANVYVGLAVTAHNNSAITTSSIGQVTVTKANAAPTVSITSPANGATFVAPASVTINANATDDVSISKVEFYNGTTLLNTDNTSPYSYGWTGVAAGTYTLKAIAYDNLNVSTTSSLISITVNPSSGCTAPQWTVGNTSYVAGTIVKNTVGGTVKKYQCTVAGWCQSTSAFYYEPGNGLAWTDCWTDLGVCTAKLGSSVLSTNSSSSYIHVYPNPSSEKVMVSGSLQVDGQVKIAIYNSVGNEMIRKDVSCPNGNFECELEIINLPSGVYTIKANSGEVVLIEKLIIN